ncbi:type II secretion system F family protein [Brevibacillus sp. H7]|uniref:type II secretion system F family protein n=1 Tax=Brevibacillus sp. H7 TaxID=3349138 RepID=UPI0037FD94BB
MISLLWIGLFLSLSFAFFILTWGLVIGPARIRERVRQLRQDDGFRPSPVPGPVSTVSRTEKHGKRKYLLSIVKERFLTLFEGNQGTRFSKQFQEQLRLAGMQITAEEMGAVLLVCFFVPLVGGFLLGHFFLGGCIGILCATLPLLYVKIQQRKRINKFNRQLNEMLTITSNSLKSGYSFLQAVQTIASEMPAPISEEFSRVIREVNMGLPLEDSMQRLNQRVKSQDFDLITTAILIQRQIGGNLSEILDNIGQTIRERVRIQGEIKALTAQGRFSALIFMGLPPGVCFMIYLMNPGYIQLLFSHPLGIAMLVAAVIGQTIGFMFIRKIVAIEV